MKIIKRAPELTKVYIQQRSSSHLFFDEQKKRHIIIKFQSLNQIAAWHRRDFGMMSCALLLRDLSV